ncbi:MAG: glycosyltransferase family 2 protein [Verrucomicrobia bacterium]|nr:glycosyltransferase family 2 protein [Verrucomicrobiota bacterium]
MFKFLIFLLFPFLILAEEKPFAVIIRSHNNKSNYQRNLDSVFSQHYQNYRIIYISDGSTDGSDALVENYIQVHGHQDRVSFYKNQNRKGRLACACQAIFSCKKNEIIIEIDGPDWITNNDVFSKLNETYANPEVWAVFQDHTPAFTTYYASLFQAIKKEDFLHADRFLSADDDRPYLAPILKMAGGHAKPIPDLLYASDQSQADHTEAVGENKQKMPHYSALNKLPLNFPEETPYGLIYQQIQDICHPTLEDYRLVHNYLFYGIRPNLERISSLYYWGQRTIRIIGDDPGQIPMSGVVHINSSGEEKENCIILYSTYNRNYPRALARLLNCIAQSDFKGDVLYRIGGWPDEAGGSLLLSHVPYAFKPCFFKEARRLGYKRILWLDTAVIPVASLNEIFAMIEDKGYFVMGNAHMVGPFMNPQAAVYFGLTKEDTCKIPSCSSGLFGVDLSHKIGRDLLENWYRAAQDPDAFFTERPDQNALSILLYQSNISDFIDIRRMPHAEINEQIQPDSLFYLDRFFVH